jgi:hypothetical protein
MRIVSWTIKGALLNEKESSGHFSLIVIREFAYKFGFP